MTVFLGTDSNVTDGSGIAYFYNHTTGLNYSTDGGSLYFGTSGTAVENATTNAYTYGALISLNVTNLLNQQVFNYTAHETRTTNTSINGAISLLLKPNSTHNLTIQAFDGNGTGGYNSTNQTYINKTYSVTTGGEDTGTYNLTGLYQTTIRLNVTKGVTTDQVTNYTANITGTDAGNWLNYSQYTGSENNATFNLMWGNYSITVDPDDYSLSRKNISVSNWNYSATVIIPVYATNSFYISFLDEITRNNINETMTLELISDATAGTYTTGNGSLSLELLTPADYTLRYRTTPTGNYTERDYYQTLVTNNYYDINLYGLKSTDGTDLVVHVGDTGGGDVEGATVKLLRYFVYCNCYEVVEMAKTSYTGDAYFIADYYDGHYKLSVDYNDVTYFLSTSPENFVLPATGFVTKTITINLEGDYYESFRGLTDVAATVSLNNATNALTFTWNDPAGIVNQGCLNVEYLDNMDYKTLEENCLNASSGSVYVVLTEHGNVTYKYDARVYTTTTYSDYTLFSDHIDKDAITDFGLLGAFLGLVVMVLLSLLFSFSAIAVLLVNLVGVVVLSLLAIAPFTTTFILGFGTLVFGLAVYLMRT